MPTVNEKPRPAPVSYAADTLGLGRLAPWPALALLVVYALAFGTLARALGPVTYVASFVPPILAAWLSGQRAGITVALLATVENHVLTLIFHASGTAPGLPMIAESLVGGLANVAVAGVAGRLRDLGRAFEAEVTLRREMEKRASTLYNTDPLTGVATRQALLDVVADRVALAQASQRGFAVLAVDLAGFARVNTALGPAVGDEVLRFVARSLASGARAGDAVGRLGADRFALLCPGAADAIDVGYLAGRVRTALDVPLATSAGEVSLSCRVGAAIHDGGATTAGEILQDAEVALQASKSRADAGVQLFDSSMRRDVAWSLRLENDLRLALGRRELSLAFQPQFDAVAGVPVGVEALLRWNHPERGTVSPADFIPLAEQNGTIIEIGEWVVLTACQQAKPWLRQWPGLSIAVNVSPRQLRDPAFAARMLAIIAKAEVPVWNLEFEITEAMTVRHETAARANLDALRTAGAKVTIDDFGVGYSSLSYLHDLPVDGIKIDRSFVARLHDDPGADAVVRAVQAICARLNLAILAEGIETPAQRDALLGRGIRRMQGYLFARPAPVTGLGALELRQLPNSAA